jgi:hypothetical protein
VPDREVVIPNAGCVGLSDRSQRVDEAAERVGDGGLGPVDEDGAALAHEDVSVVYLFVNQREGDQGSELLEEILCPVPGGDRRRAAVRGLEGLYIRHELELELGVEGDDLLPARSLLAGGEERSQLRPGVTRQHPPPVGMEHFGHAVGTAPSELLRQRRLECQ